MPRTCQTINCQLPVFGGSYCKYHQQHRTDGKAPNRLNRGSIIKRGTYPSNASRKPKTPIKKASKKRAEINSKQYEPESRKFRKENPLCALKIKGVCTKFTMGVHHTRGKATIELLLKKEWWLPACNSCNNWCEANSEAAKAMGLKIPDYTSKLTTVKKL